MILDARPEMVRRRTYTDDESGIQKNEQASKQTQREMIT